MSPGIRRSLSAPTLRGHFTIWLRLARTVLALLLGTAASFAQSAESAKEKPLQTCTISGFLSRFDKTPHGLVPVDLLNSANQVLRTQLSDRSGRFRFDGLSPGT